MGKDSKKRRRERGSGSLEKRGKKWQICWRENGRKRFRTFTEEGDARAALRLIVGQVEREGVGLPVEKPPAETLAKLAEAWLERRKLTHRSHSHDAGRWGNHLAAHFGRLAPDEVDEAAIRSFIEAKLSAGLNSSTVKLCVALLSTFFSDLVERHLSDRNPVKSLPRATRKLYKPTHNPAETPFLHSLEDVRRVFAAMPAPSSIVYAVAAFTGARPGEVLAMEWQHVDLERGLIHIRQQVTHGKLSTVTKDDEARDVSIQKPLIPILKAWRLKTGGDGFLFRPIAPGRGRTSPTGSQFLKLATVHGHLRAALTACELPTSLTFYQCSRHTFGSLWALADGSLEKLSRQLGHSSVTTTEKHYMHLKPNMFTDADRSILDVDLTRKPGKVVAMSAAGENVSRKSAARKSSSRGTTVTS